MSDLHRRVLIQQLESLQRSGVCQLRKSRRVAAGQYVPPPAPARIVRLEAPVPAGRDDATVPSSDARAGAAARDPAAHGPQSELDVLAEQVRQCTRCAELAATRTQTVFGIGNPRARLCFFGEAPGADEDRLGEPFVGRAGQLLNEILKACTLRREDVYILNVLKCRPPGNRTPARDEVTNCHRFFERQLEIIQPEFICCLGAVAASALLETTQSLGSLRGRFHPWRNSRVLVTYHPAYLLRNPAKKRDTWIDMQLLMQTMGIELPAAAKRQS